VPCYRCGARQTDPGKGPSPWKRGVIDDEQVLVCPQCQATHDWTADLDRCGSCGSTMLLRALGETRCRACSWTKHAAPAGRAGDSALADEVAAALRRRFGG
jgi:DNA-directed RNA polymerase subunit RPC12/RpoP